MAKGALDVRKIVKKHAGSYVALKEGTNKVVATGKDLVETSKKASSKGYRNAVLFKVPEPNQSYTL